MANSSDNEKPSKKEPKKASKPSKRPKATKLPVKKNKEVVTNPRGNNKYTYLDPMEPYTLKYLRAKVYLDAGKTIREVIALTGLSNGTVCRIKQGHYNLSSGVNQSVIEQLKKSKSAKFEALQHRFMDAIDGDKIKNASLSQLIVGTGIIYDKQRLEEGKSTENHAMSVTDRASQFLEKSDAALEQLRQEMKAKGIDPDAIEDSSESENASDSTIGGLGGQGDGTPSV